VGCARRRCIGRGGRDPSLRAIAETGVDAMAFVPIGPDPDDQLRLLADTILPELPG